MRPDLLGEYARTNPADFVLFLDDGLSHVLAERAGYTRTPTFFANPPGIRMNRGFLDSDPDEPAATDEARAQFAGYYQVAKFADLFA